MTSKKSILIVEPDATLLQAIAEQILRPKQYQLFMAQGQNEGLQMALANAPDLLILHLLPEIATSFLTRMADAHSNIPVIMVVEQTSTQINVDLLRLGVRDYVVWPVVPDDLLQTVDRILDHNHNSQYIVNRSALNFEFADMAAHLLRNPINIIQTSIRCLQTLDLAPQEQQAVLDKMWNQSQRLTDFVNELLKTLRFEAEGTSIQTSAVDLLSLVNRMLELVRHEKPELVFSLIAPPQLPPVAADPPKIEMIVLNLLISAIRRCQVGGNIVVSLASDAGEVKVSIRDDGKPIPVHSLDQVFQSYYPVGISRMNIPASYQLGLYTTRRLVELHRGRVWAQNHTGEGSEFGFALPIWETEQ